MVNDLARGTGRRKTAVARVYLRNGTGKINVNGKPLNEYFHSSELEREIIESLDVTDSIEKYDVLIRVTGGGLHGQAGACRHGLARALVSYDETNRRSLRAKKLQPR